MSYPQPEQDRRNQGCGDGPGEDGNLDVVVGGAVPAEGEFPDQQVNSDDRDLKLNQMLSVSWNFYIPFDYQVTE